MPKKEERAREADALSIKPKTKLSKLISGRAKLYTTPARAAAARVPVPTCFIGWPQKHVGEEVTFRWTGAARLVSSGVRLIKLPGVS